MVRRWLGRCAAVLLLFCATLGTVGCNFDWLTVQIPDYASNRVEGVWLWRLSESSGQWVRDTRIDFLHTATMQGIEIVSYMTTVGPLGERNALPADLVHDPANPDAVTVSLAFLRLSAPGTFRVSTFNASGDSQLSAESAVF